MKMRIRGSSIRLRLSQREIETLAERGLVEDAIAFPPVVGPASRLVYALSVSNELQAPVARFEGARIEVMLPAKVAARWTSSEEVGVEAEEPLADGSVLRILVEKDFACLKPRAGEDDADAYPNPGA
jgi:hypothetical protein